MRAWLTVAAILACTAALPGCGNSDDASSSSEAALPPGHRGVRVIEGWVDTLREGDVEGAAAYFALPSVVENGTGPVILHDRADAVAFNDSLPCGARLLRARPEGRFIAVTFRLTDRPGGGCGSGTGALARTAFIVRHGKIVQWRRLPNPPGSEPAHTGPVV